jgi:hypothetical protein
MSGPGHAQDDMLVSADLAGRLRAAEAEVGRLRSQLQRVEASAAYQVGQVLSEGARHPRSAPLQVPRQLFGLYRRWRRAGGTRHAPAIPDASWSSRGTMPTSAAEATDVARVLAERVPLGVCERDLPVVAGVLHPRTRLALEQCANVVPLPPSGGHVLLDRVRPDVLLVDASAGREGQWAHVGTYADPARDRDLLELVATARGRHIPVVAWRSVPTSHAPLFAEAADVFDVVLDLGTEIEERRWSRGVPLQIFNPIRGVNGHEPVDVLESLARGGAVADAVPEPLRALPIDREREPSEQRSVMRVLHAQYSTPVMLSRLLATIGIAYEPPERAVSLLLTVDDPGTALAVVGSVLDQVHRPVEVLISSTPTAARMARALTAAGVRSRVCSATDTRRLLVEHASTSLVACRTGPLPGPHHLMDLVLGAECSGADAVGYTTADEFTFVPSLPLATSLVRRDAATEMGDAMDLTAWVQGGRRLLGITSTEITASQR